MPTICIHDTDIDPEQSSAATSKPFVYNRTKWAKYYEHPIDCRISIEELRVIISKCANADTIIYPNEYSPYLNMQDKYFFFQKL